jgi:hypothetical protein
MTDVTEQCTCGVIFTAPMIGDEEFLAHVTNGTHKAALLVEVCGPCFMGFCEGCEKVRRSDVQRWKCRCMHDIPIAFNRPDDERERMRLMWSEWLTHGRNSSVSIGIDEVVNDDHRWNPLKEI